MRMFFLLFSLIIFTAGVLLPVNSVFAQAQSKCQVDKLTMNSNETFNFSAENLEPNTNYQLILNNLTYGLRSKSTNDGKWTTNNVQPEAILPSLSGELRVWLKRVPGAYACQDIIINITPVSRSNVKYYRCDTPKQACVESVDYMGNPNPVGAITNKSMCDQACLNNGKTTSLTLRNNNINNPGPTVSSAGSPCPGQAGVANGVMTAIGCVPTEPKALIEGLLKISAGAGGGIAFLLMVFGALQMVAAEGNPDNVKKGQEQLTSAIIGLLFVIFSVLLMQIIGVNILGLPGFGK